MNIDISKLPPGFKIEISKEDLLAFADKILVSRSATVTVENEDKVYCDVNEGADFLNIARQTLYGMTSRKEIQFFKKGKKIYFKKSDLIAYIESGKQKTRAEGTEEVMDYLRRKYTK